MSDVVYRSRVEIIRKRGLLREATLPARDEPVSFGVHSEVAEHYGASPDEYPPTTTTIDYLVAAAGG